MPTLTPAAQDLLTRLLRRLPPSLWDTDPTSPTVQRELYAAVAQVAAVWLEQREIVRTMTLLLEAQGIDLDVLLADYGLKRYLQRPDAYARQVGEQILFRPQGTMYSIAQLADLLFDLPHRTLRTGRGHTHVFVAQDHDVTTPHSYWGLLSAEGLWCAVTVDAEVATISQAPPPGLDLSPGVQMLHWVLLQDETEADWYMTIADDVLVVSQTPPAWGTGATEGLEVLDGQGNLWHFSVDRGSEAVVTTLVTGLTTFGYWQLQDNVGTTYAVWIEAEVATIATTAPGGATNQTPAGGPFQWFTVLDASGTPWYAHIEADTLMVDRVAPAGTGTAEPFDLLDVANTRWRLSVDAGAEALVSTVFRLHNDDLIAVSAEHRHETVQLIDSGGTVWWFHITTAGAGQFLAAKPLDSLDVTPPGGPYRWLRLFDTAGTRWYLSPSLAGAVTVSTANPGGTGLAGPQALGDADGVQWHYGVTPGGTFGASNINNVDFGGMATTLCLNDGAGNRWFWRVRNGTLEWSSVLWPDSLDQSPWGELGWLHVLNVSSVLRYVFPDLTGGPTAAAGPPLGSSWGWQAPVSLVDAEGQRWHLTVSAGDVVGVALDSLPEIPPLPHPIQLRDAVEAFAHIQPAGGLVTAYVS